MFCNFRTSNLPVLSEDIEEIHIQSHLSVYSPKAILLYVFQGAVLPYVNSLCLFPFAEEEKTKLVCFSMPELGVLFHEAIHVQTPSRQNLKCTFACD